MFMKCCNPECEAPFDHREGRLIRVTRPAAECNRARDRKAIEHFWICGKCSDRFVLRQDGETRGTLRSREIEPYPSDVPESVCAA